MQQPRLGAARALVRAEICTATHCHTLQHNATHWETLPRTAAHCDTMQHPATHLAQGTGAR